MPRKPLPVTRTPPAKPPPKPRKLAGAALKAHQTKTCPAPPAEKGNTRSVIHGAASPKLVAPLREQHLRVIRVDYPDLDSRRATLLADRLARIDLLSEWLERQRSIVYGKQGDVSAAAVLCDKWSTRAEQVIKEAEAERRKPRKFDLAMAMSDLGEAEDNPLDTTLNG